MIFHMKEIVFFTVNCQIKPTAAMFSSCSNMVTSVMEYNDIPDDCEEMIEAANRFIIAKVKPA